MEKLINQAEAASFLDVKAPTLERWRWAGEGPAFVRVGRCILYEPRALREWVSCRTVTSTSDPGVEGIA
ncbi:helix-turn-helix domain protein [bacterium BMS3Bbin12]|nr:helix-turn-helix domain protein [bacterium BMS3Bbin12]GBE49247.1 helix-turn-helix domain protein [bacterium BMS3Bbin13]